MGSSPLRASLTRGWKIRDHGRWFGNAAPRSMTITDKACSALFPRLVRVVNGLPSTVWWMYQVLAEGRS